MTGHGAIVRWVGVRRRQLANLTKDIRKTFGRLTKHDMNRLFGQMLRMPLGLMVANIEFLAQAMREFQGVFDETVGHIGSSWAITAPNVPEPVGYSSAVLPHSANFHQSSLNAIREELPMQQQMQANRCYDSDCDPSASFQDCDLSGEGVIKRIRWYVTYTKEDFVASFIILDAPGGDPISNQDIITENTTHDRVWGQKKGEFIGAMADRRVPVPLEWGGNNPGEATIDTSTTPNLLLKLTTEGLEDYLDIQIECVSRSCEVKPCYEKDQIKVLREMKDNIRALAGRI